MNKALKVVPIIVIRLFTSQNKIKLLLTGCGKPVKMIINIAVRGSGGK